MDAETLSEVMGGARPGHNLDQVGDRMEQLAAKYGVTIY